MELHHLHVAQRQARRGTPSAMPSAALSAEQAMTLYIVGPPPWRAASPGAVTDDRPRPEVEEQARRPRARRRREELDGPALLVAL